MSGDPRRLLESDAIGVEGKRVLHAALDVEPPAGAEDALWSAIAARTSGSGSDGSSGGNSPGPGAENVAVPAAKGMSAVAAIGGIAVVVATGLAAVVLSGRDAASDSLGSVPALTTAASTDAPALVPTASASTAEPPPVRSAADTPSATTAPRRPATSTGSTVRRAAEPSSTAVTPASSENALLAESRAIREAREALRSGDAATAVERLEAAERHFPGGALVQEREVLLVEALAAEKRTDEARTRARAFLRTHAGSPLAPRVRAHADE